MQPGILTKINSKGQIVIPAEYRNLLGITPDKYLNVVVRESSVVIIPTRSIIADTHSENSYLDILGKTKGAWGKSAPNELDRNNHKRELELDESRERRRKW